MVRLSSSVRKGIARAYVLLVVPNCQNWGLLIEQIKEHMRQASRSKTGYVVNKGRMVVNG